MMIENPKKPIIHYIAPGSRPNANHGGRSAKSRIGRDQDIPTTADGESPCFVYPEGGYMSVAMSLSQGLVKRYKKRQK